MKPLAITTIALYFVSTAIASFCGDSAIPFSFEALPDGQPVLGCARPTCFGWAPNGLPASQTGNFYRINRRPDGFMRNDRATVPAFSQLDFRRQRPMMADCEPTYQSNSCDPAKQWVGGIAPLLNVSAFPTVLQCCSYEVLGLSTDRGVAVVNPGQIVVGGEVMRNGKQYAFDYVADVMKTINADGTVSYDVSVRRMPCMPLPESYGKHGDGKNSGSFKAFQAPNVAQPPIPINPPQGAQGPFNADQNSLVEETVAEEAVQVAQPGAQSAIQPGAQSAIQPGAQSALQPVGPAGQSATVQFFEAQPIYGPPQPQFIPPPPPPQFAAPIPPAAVAPPAAVPVAAPPTYYYPAYYGGGGGGGYYCFTDDTEVELGNGQTVRMDQLKKHDWIKTIEDGKAAFAPVNMWLHRVPSQEAEFVKLTTEDGKVLKLTGKHYIYKTECSSEPVTPDNISDLAVFAEDVEEGDCVYSVSQDHQITETRVVKKEWVKQTGIYAPMTSNGKLIVNGIYASCHNVVQHHELQRTFFTYLDAANEWLNGILNRDVNEIPYGMETMVKLVEFVLPKQLF